jgi:hypothetical protein
VQLQAHIRFVRILIQVVYAVGIERGSPPFDAVNGVPLRKQQFGKIGAVLPGDSRDQCCLRQVVLRKIGIAAAL